MIILIVMFYMSSIVYVAVKKKTLAKTTCTGKALFHLIGYNTSGRDAKAGGQGRSLKQKTTALLLDSHSTTFLIQALGRPSFPRIALLTELWALLHQSAVKKTPHRQAHRSMLEAIPQPKVPLPKLL